VVLFEPNPIAIDVLRVNIALNRISGWWMNAIWDMRYPIDAIEQFSSTWSRNLGVTRMETTENFGIPVVRGDTLTRVERLTFRRYTQNKNVMAVPKETASQSG
jgi:hypothetical protein